jgi:menaquinone-dependent protoporphyrinogen oxidase
MARILIAYSTTDGHTARICQRLAELLAAQAHTASVAPLAAVEERDLAACDKIVIGASIRYGRHSQAVLDFIERHQQVLNRKPSAFFSVNVVARKPEKNQPHTNHYVRKLLRRIPWRPTEVGVFAGKLDYPRYGFLDRNIIRFIMLITGGPTDPKSVVEFTDWRVVEDFAGRLAAL